MFLRFLENLLESGILFCCATAATKTAPGIILLGSNYFAASFYKALGVRFSREAKERDAPILVHSLLSHFLYIGMISLPTFQCPSKTPCHVCHAHESAKPPSVLSSTNLLLNLSQSTISSDLAAASECLLMHSSAEAFICAIS